MLTTPEFVEGRHTTRFVEEALAEGRFVPPTEPAPVAGDGAPADGSRPFHIAVEVDGAVYETDCVRWNGVTPSHGFAGAPASVDAAAAVVPVAAALATIPHRNDVRANRPTANSAATAAERDHLWKELGSYVQVDDRLMLIGGETIGGTLIGAPRFGRFAPEDAKPGSETFQLLRRGNAEALVVPAAKVIAVSLGSPAAVSPTNRRVSASHAPVING